MTDGATMPAFSDERLIDAAGAVVADRAEQRPLLVVARGQPHRGSRGCAPLLLPRSLLPESSAGSGAPSCIGFGSSAGRHACHHLLALMGCKTLPAFRSAEHDVLKQHHEEPEREASRSLVRAAVLVCVRDDLMPDRLLPGRQVSVIFRIARDCEADHTPGQLGNGTRLIIVYLYASVRPHGG